jgi:predicted MFS family arabinose efflux permease
MNWRIALLLIVVGAAVAMILLLPAMPQSEAYHNFADQSMLTIVLLLAFFPPRYTRTVDFVASFAFYGLAKVFE